MKSIKLFTMFLLIVLLASCKNAKSTIEKDLNTRFTKFEIVEIKEDSANIYEAHSVLIELIVQISQMNLDVISSMDSLENGIGSKSKAQYIVYIDSLYTNMINKLDSFENSDTLKVDKCYYVKYLVANGAVKETVEEYYYINEKNGDVIHRPVEWKAFLKSVDYSEYVNDVMKYYKDFLRLKY